MSIRRAFTLIELMVIIAIVAIIAAIVIPNVVSKPPVPINVATLTVGTHVRIGLDGSAVGVVLAIKRGGPETPDLITVRVGSHNSNSSGNIYSEADFLTSELYLYP